MNRYKVVSPTNWYTGSGGVGNSVNNKIQPGFEFDSDQDGVKKGIPCHHVVNDVKWIPTSACISVIANPPSDDDDTPDDGGIDTEDIVKVEAYYENGILKVKVNDREWIPKP